MALSDDQKLDLIVRAYAEGYQGDFEELFELEESLQSGRREHPLVTAPKKYIPQDPPPAHKKQRKPTFKLSDNFDDDRAKDLIRSYNPKEPTAMPYGEPVVGSLGADEYSEYKKGGFKLADLAGQPQLDADDYLYNYTNTYQNGGPVLSPEDLRKQMASFNAELRNERLGNPSINLSQPSDNTRTIGINEQDIVDRYNVESRKTQEEIARMNYRPTIGPDPLADVTDQGREIIQAQRKQDHLNDNLSQYQPGTQAYENLSLKDKLLVRGRKKSTQLTLLPQYAFTFSGPSDKQYDLSKDWSGRFRNVGTGIAYFGAAELAALGMGQISKGVVAFNKAYPTSITGLGLRKNIPYYTGKAFEKTGIPGTMSMVGNYFSPRGTIKGYAPAKRNFNQYAEDYYYGLDQNAQLKERIRLAKEQLAKGTADITGAPSGSSRIPLSSRQKASLENRIKMMEKQLDEGVPARFKGSHEDIRSNPAFYIPGKGAPASKTMSNVDIGNYRDDLYNYYYAVEKEKGLTNAAAKKKAQQKLQKELGESAGVFHPPKPSGATMGLMGSQQGSSSVGGTFGDVFVKGRSKLQRLTDPYNPFFNKEKFLSNQQAIKAHELSHMWDQGGKMLSDKAQADLLKPFGVTLSEQRAATQAYRAAQNRGATFNEMTAQERMGYYMNPTEIVARMREAKSRFNILPGQNMSQAQFNFWSKNQGAGVSPFDRDLIRLGYKLENVPGLKNISRKLRSGRRDVGGRDFGSGLTNYLWQEQARRESLGRGVNYTTPHDDFYKLMLDPRFKYGGYK